MMTLADRINFETLGPGVAGVMVFHSSSTSIICHDANAGTGMRKFADFDSIFYGLVGGFAVWVFLGLFLSGFQHGASAFWGGAFTSCAIAHTFSGAFFSALSALGLTAEFTLAVFFSDSFASFRAGVCTGLLIVVWFADAFYAEVIPHVLVELGDGFPRIAGSTDFPRIVEGDFSWHDELQSDLRAQPVDMGGDQSGNGDRKGLCSFKFPMSPTSLPHKAVAVNL